MTRTKVTVIVPVYNPGEYLERCVDSILAQSLPPDRFEAIFVDDGSTDGSPARLDALAAEHPHVKVIHQPNSGWPGKPRNVGIDAARGRYVYFMDHDDVITPEALERLVAFGDRNGSDIVIGKMAGHGRGAPHQLFLETRDRVTIHDSGIIGALSPHKLFRTSFLDAHGLRYPEGRRRLEDQVFVVEAYFAASVISILADYTCYVHLARDDRANAASGQYDPTGGFDAPYYYAFLREVLDIVERNTEPGPARDRLHRRFLHRELLGRLIGRRFVVAKPERRQVLVDEIRSVVNRYIAPTAEVTLPPPLRIRMELVRQGRLDLLLLMAREELGLRLDHRVRRVETLGPRRVRLVLDTSLATAEGPLLFERHGEELLLKVPDAVGAAVSREARVLERPVRGSVHVLIRRAKDSADLTLQVPEAWTPVKRRGGVALVHHVEVVIDGDDPREDHALGRGRWNVILRAQLVGHRLETEVRRSAGPRRSRPLVLVNGSLIRTEARWEGFRGRGRVLSRAARVSPALARRLANLRG